MQLGVGTSHGCESIVHAVRAWCRDHGDREDVCTLMVDLQNAFNSVDRVAFQRKIRQCAPELTPFIDSMYAQPTNILAGNSVLKSSRGCQQGDPLGPALFALAIQDIVEETILAVISAFPQELDISAFYLDDGVFCGSAKAIAMAAELLHEKFATVGLHMNPNKCQVIPRGRSSPQMRETFRKYHWLADGNFELLGAPIGTDQYCGEKARDKVLAAEPLLQAISQLPQKQTALHLLRYCGTYSLVTYVMRTTPHEYIQHVLTDFDSEVRAALGEVMGAEVPMHAWMQAQLSMAKGGLGLRSPVLHAPGAYLASTFQAASLASSIYAGFSTDTPWASACRASLTQQIDPTVPVCLDGDGLTQKNISLAIDRSLMHRIMGMSS
eukprot:6470239-Amphidinium_carterae.1